MSLIIWSLLAIAYGIALHELSHVCVVLINGGKLVTLKPYPHMHGGRLYFGRMEYTDYVCQPVFYYVPVVADMLAVFLFLSMLTLVEVKEPLLILAASNVIDSIVWTYGYFFGSDATDGKRLRRLMKERDG